MYLPMKLVKWLIGISCFVTLTGCGNEIISEPYPSKALTIIVSFAPGGGTAESARALLPYVEKNLGMPITISFKTGEGGWSGWKELLDEDADGYTLAYINTPNIITGYMDPASKRPATLDDFELIANHVMDYGVIAIRHDETRFENFAELMAYAQLREVTAAATGYASDDNIAQLKINQLYGSKFVGTQFRGTAQGVDAVMKGRIDVLFANVGELCQLHKDQKLKIVAIMSPVRSEIIPDVPTMDELGYPGIYSYSARGIAMKKGVDPNKVKKVAEAFAAGINHPEHVKKMQDVGLQVQYMDGEAYKRFLLSEENNIRNIFELLGWR